jgi:hypothetical protein
VAKSSRVTRTIDELIAALDHHQYLLRDSLYDLREDPAHLKTLATELRTLVCMSSGTEGLLWRVADELNVSDMLELQVAESVNREHPLNQGLDIQQLPMQRPGEGPPAPPAGQVRLRDVIKNCEAIYVSQITDRIFTHELLIGAIAGQMGGAHEAEGLDHSLVKLNNLLLNRRQLYFGVLTFDAELTLQIGERVLDRAEHARGFKRATRPANYGDVTLCLRLARRDWIFGRVPIFTVRSEISESEIKCFVSAQVVIFTLSKRGAIVAEFSLPYPADWETGCDAMFAVCYSSAHRQIRLIVNGEASGPPQRCDFGWLDARELRRPELHSGFEDLISLRCIPLYSRLLRPAECAELLSISADGRELRAPRIGTGPFPD